MAKEKQIQIEVRDKIATFKSKNFNLVGGNSDYDVVFDFDKDWDAYPKKTAVFVFGKSKPICKLFDGNVCEGVAIYDATMCLIGVFSGDLLTTTPAAVDCVYRSILDEASGEPEAPSENVYNQIIELINKYIKAIDIEGKYAPLVDGKVPAKNLPSYIDDVVNGTMDAGRFHIKNSNESAFDEIDDDGYIINPRRGVLYISDEGNGKPPKVYRWSGTAFVEIASGSAIPAPEGGGFLRAQNGEYILEYGYLLPDAPDLDGKIMRYVDCSWKPVDLPTSGVDKDYVDELVGDISTALDELHTYAQNLVNGGNA